MPLWCRCRMMPACEYSHCRYPAELSAFVLATWKPPLRYTTKFFCLECWETFKEAWAKPIPGIDRPANADEDWRPSLMEMMRHARIAMDFENRNKKPPPAVAPRPREFWIPDPIPRHKQDPRWLAIVARMFAGVSSVSSTPSQTGGQ
jgi:hypothetical protein